MSTILCDAIGPRTEMCLRELGHTGWHRSEIEEWPDIPEPALPLSTRPADESVCGDSPGAGANYRCELKKDHPGDHASGKRLWVRGGGAAGNEQPQGDDSGLWGRVLRLLKLLELSGGYGRCPLCDRMPHHEDCEWASLMREIPYPVPAAERALWVEYVGLLNAERGMTMPASELRRRLARRIELRAALGLDEAGKDVRK